VGHPANKNLGWGIVMNGIVVSSIIGYGLAGILWSRKAENPKAELLSSVGLLLGGGALIFEHRLALLSLLLFVSGTACFVVGIWLKIHKSKARFLFVVGWLLLGSAAILKYLQYISAAAFFWLLISGVIGLVGGTLWDKLSKLRCRHYRLVRRPTEHRRWPTMLPCRRKWV
jgi:hypothetical protein